MKKNYGMIVFLIVLATVITMFATNPTKTEFKEYVEENISTNMQSSGITSNSFLNNLIGLVSGKITSSVADIAYTRENYYLFSIYKIKGTDIDLEFLGWFRQFNPISKNLDPSNINRKFTDIISVANSEVILKEDYYSCYEVTLNKPAEVSVGISFKSGVAFEMYAYDESSFNNWKESLKGIKNLTVKHYPDFHITIDRDLNKSGNLNSGKYYFVFENMDSGDVFPPMNFNEDTCYFKVSITKKDL